ncbi:hypothetical protein, partial [Glutamicibacter sp.]|uniref:hypothetical protein n=1 Tax=Glutamicibacter sp. TaxID=1931995 RepID=UPI002FCC772E
DQKTHGLHAKVLQLAPIPRPLVGSSRFAVKRRDAGCAGTTGQGEHSSSQQRTERFASISHGSLLVFHLVDSLVRRVRED